MMGGQKSFEIFKTPFDSHRGVPTIRDSNPVARVSWLQLKFAAGFSRLPRGVVPASGRIRSLTIWCFEQEWHLKSTASRRVYSCGQAVGLLCLRLRRSSVTRSDRVEPRGLFPRSSIDRLLCSSICLCSSSPGSLRRVSCSRALDKCGQATKGVWGMSWHQKAMKGVEVCEKLGGVDKQMMIPRFPN